MTILRISAPAAVMVDVGCCFLVLSRYCSYVVMLTSPEVDGDVDGSKIGSHRHKRKGREEVAPRFGAPRCSHSNKIHQDLEPNSKISPASNIISVS